MDFRESLPHNPGFACSIGAVVPLIAVFSDEFRVTPNSITWLPDQRSPQIILLIVPFALYYLGEIRDWVNDQLLTHHWVVSDEPPLSLVDLIRFAMPLCGTGSNLNHLASSNDKFLLTDRRIDSST